MRKTLYLSAFLLSSIPLFGRESYGDWVNYSQSVMSATILLVIATVGGMALRWTYKNRYLPGGGKDSFIRFAWRNALVRLTLFVIAIVFVNEDDSYEGPYYVRRPFDREPGWGVSSTNYNIGDLIARGEHINGN